jgi:hypothetical protein
LSCVLHKVHSNRRGGAASGEASAPRLDLS